MKYLKKFKHFENINVEVTDRPEIMPAKEKLNDLEKSIKEYPKVKAELDRTFTNIKSDDGDTILKDKINEIRDKFPNNPFIEGYTKVLSLQSRIKKIQDELVKYNDDLYQNQEDLKLLNSDNSSDSSVESKTNTINDIKSKQKLKGQEIIDTQKDLTTAESDLKKKMDDIKKELVDSSKKITDDIKK